MLQITKRNAYIVCATLVLTQLPILVWYVLTSQSESRGLVPASELNIEQLIELTPSPTSLSSVNATSAPHVTGSLSSVKHQSQINIKTDCSTVHVAMVTSGGIAGRHLYTTIKSIIMHRSTPLHFHFITDNRAKTVLQAMVKTWLVPAISHDYYDFKKAWTTVASSFSRIHCSKTHSIHLNLDLVLPNSVGHVIVIEPSSVVGIDLAKLWSLTVSRTKHTMTVCQSNCVSYCNDGDSIELTKWGAVGLNLIRISSSAKNAAWTPQLLSSDCTPLETVDNKTMKLLSKDKKRECAIVEEFDGELLRTKMTVMCPNGMQTLVKQAPSTLDVCQLFTWERQAERRELPFVLGHRYKSSGDYDVTLATHLDYNRLDLLERILGHWDGPASVAIHVTDSQVQGVVDFLLHSKSLQHRVNVTYHFLFRVGPSYPPNHARELAHRFVSTPYMLILDVDFVPSFGLYDSLKEKLKAGTFGNMEKAAVVIPAFETNQTNFTVPQNKSIMLDLFLNHKVHQFHHTYFYAGHGPTDYNKWKNATRPYFALWDNGYEPYYVVKTSVVSFDHRFIARFHNKCSHSVELHMAGYKFVVFPYSFAVHLPHTENSQNMDKLVKCSKQWYKDWMKEKRVQYKYTKKDVRDSLP